MIGIIGFGRFGRLMTEYLAKDFTVKVFNRSDKSTAIVEAGAIPATPSGGMRAKDRYLERPHFHHAGDARTDGAAGAPGDTGSRCLLREGLSGRVDDGGPSTFGFIVGHTPHVRPPTALPSPSTTGKSYSATYGSTTTGIKR